MGLFNENHSKKEFPEILTGKEKERPKQQLEQEGRRDAGSRDLAQFGRMPPTFTVKLLFFNFLCSFSNRGWRRS
jgi:hypothetical protein